LNAAKEHNIDLSESWFIGDSFSDVQAGIAAGVKTIFLTSGGGSGSRHEKELQDVKPHAVKNDLLEAVQYILQ
jgi:phosphoglycolate phosphatase-like HAD superfamily hydrolase